MGFAFLLSHLSAISTLRNVGCCVVTGAVPITLSMVTNIVILIYDFVKYFLYCNSNTTIMIFHFTQFDMTLYNVVWKL